MASEKVVILSGNNFELEVLNSDVPVLVDFWATWCGPCRMIAPIIDQLAEEYEGRIKVAKVDVDENRDLAQRYGVMSIPTIIIFKNGEVVNQVVGARPKVELEKMINASL